MKNILKQLLILILLILPLLTISQNLSENIKIIPTDSIQIDTISTLKPRPEPKIYCYNIDDLRIISKGLAERNYYKEKYGLMVDKSKAQEILINDLSQENTELINQNKSLTEKINLTEEKLKSSKKNNLLWGAGGVLLGIFGWHILN